VATSLHTHTALIHLLIPKLSVIPPVFHLFLVLYQILTLFKFPKEQSRSLSIHMSLKFYRNIVSSRFIVLDLQLFNIHFPPSLYLCILYQNFYTLFTKYSHPTALANLYRTQVKKYRTSQENIGYIGHMYVSVFTVYISAMPGIQHHHEHTNCITSTSDTVVCGHGIDIDKSDCFIHSLFVLFLFSCKGCSTRHHHWYYISQSTPQTDSQSTSHHQMMFSVSA